MATKKTFTDKIQQKAVNPTLQFISQPEETQAKPITIKVAEMEGTRTPAQPQTVKVVYSDGSDVKRTAHRAKPQYDEETKSRRLQLLLTPSLYREIKSKAAEERMSVNELINSLLTDAIRK